MQTMLSDLLLEDLDDDLERWILDSFLMVALIIIPLKAYQLVPHNKAEP